LILFFVSIFSGLQDIVSFLLTNDSRVQQGD
jgi:hypothetical protein